ncbi:MAG: response regulator, partial [Nitratireductor sp.]|nr:response regulator [Nitratireductor sp.]
QHGEDSAAEAIAAARKIGELPAAPARAHDDPLGPIPADGEPGGSDRALAASSHMPDPAFSAAIAAAKASEGITEPVQAESEPVPLPAATSSLQGAASGTDILIAEDNEVNRMVFTQILQAAGWSFAVAEDGEQAVAMSADLNPRLILMDVSMPGMNGLEATAAIRQREAGQGLPRMPIVGVTAHALKGDMERCLEAGMDDYLTKPVSPAKLEAKIAEWLEPGATRAIAG